MNQKSQDFTAILLAAIWVNASEFFRNEVLLKHFWVSHYQSLGLTFPADTLNGIVWIIWGFSFAGVVFVISRKFSLSQTTLLSWFVAFVLMWMVTWNLKVLPVPILAYALPLSLIEAFLGSYLCHKISPVKS